MAQARALLLHPSDNIAVCTTAVHAGDSVSVQLPDGSIQTITAAGDIPFTNKIALHDIASGDRVLKYGKTIGIACSPIQKGTLANDSNIASQQRAYIDEYLDERSTSNYAPAVPAASVNDSRTFLGYRRSDGAVGVRNHVLILPACACASETCRIVASQVQGTKNVIINVGCSDVAANTELTQRILTGFALNPNVYGVVIIGLGCETVGHRALREKLEKLTDKPIVSFGIQEEGGTVATAAKAVRAARAMVQKAARVQRTPCPLSDLFVAIECGGSDATSGIAANPTVGIMSDHIVDAGGTTMMSETIEFVGAEHVLARRGATVQLHNAIIGICEEYEKHLAAAGQDYRAGQPTPGNKAGGLSTIEEKSLGCIKKGGTRPVVEVLAEGCRPTQKGALIMDTPGYDISSVTSMVAGGAALVVFTTGRGTPTGHALAPVIKITGNRETAHRMADNMDIDVSNIIEGTQTIAQAGEQILEEVLAVASGRPTKAESFGFSDIAVDHICRYI